ncbi:hypothetical protein GGD38_006486 [Chitinophagaceae bacterium OAS944]|nr:hypothetical protein [Chitinophagaceae bacterium OAS944]
MSFKNKIDQTQYIINFYFSAVILLCRFADLGTQIFKLLSTESIYA